MQQTVLKFSAFIKNGMSASNCFDDDLPSDDDLPMVPHITSRRDEFLTCPLLETQAMDDDESGSCSSNSLDDADLSDLSCVSSRFSHPDADHDVYLNSLSSQAMNEGWEPPMNQERRSEPFVYRLHIFIAFYVC